MDGSILRAGRPWGRRGRSLGVVLVVIAGGALGGCQRSDPGAIAATKPGGRRQQMLDFMKTQKPTAAARPAARRHP